MGQYQEKRTKLHNLLLTITPNVYYQAPSSGIKYPCIIYSYGKPEIKKADNKNYLRDDMYSVILIHQKYLNDLVDKLIDLDHCSFDRHYVEGDLHHFAYTIYI